MYCCRDRLNMTTRIRWDTKWSGFWYAKKAMRCNPTVVLPLPLVDDADTTGVFYDQLAGALFGEEGIPETWKA
jgi:ADP-ribosylglycohydrolase